jgi:Cytochrome c7 and related cytochrome c
LFVVAWFATALAAQSASKPAPEQPLPFSHLKHAGDLKLQCRMCHPNPDPGETMRIAAPAVCLQCHAAVKPIQQLADAAKENREIRWVRVYEIPGYVSFSHRTHLAAGNKCEECHGPVAERARLSREGDISMGGCMECHRVKKAGLDCTYCHEQRQ